MLKYLLRRLNLFLITAFILTVIAFMLQHWFSGGMNDRNYAQLYVDYMYNIFQGQWGYSSIDHHSLFHKGLTAFASTLELCLVASIISIIVAFPLGILAGLKRNGLIDYTIMTIALCGLAIPVFWLAIIMTMLPNFFGINLPVDGHSSLVFEVPVISGFSLIDTLMAADHYQMRAFSDRVAHLTLPSIVLSFFLITEIIRLTRHAVTMVMQSNYVKAAYAKGMATEIIVLRHVLKNALPPIIHQLRLQLSTIISFAMTIEIVFSSGGAGVWLLTSIQQGDYLALPTALLIISGFILLSSILIDILLMIISPTRRNALYADQ